MSFSRNQTLRDGVECARYFLRSALGTNNCKGEGKETIGQKEKLRSDVNQ